MCLMSYANNKGADQPAYPRSLISDFIVRCLDSIMSLDSIARWTYLRQFKNMKSHRDEMCTISQLFNDLNTRVKHMVKYLTSIKAFISN